MTDKARYEVFKTAVDLLRQEVSGKEKPGVKDFFKVLLEPVVKGYSGSGSGDHPFDHMFGLNNGVDKGEKHFPGVNFNDPKQVQDLLRSFWRCILDKENKPTIHGGKEVRYGKFSHGVLKGKPFQVNVNTGESSLRGGWEITDKEALKEIKSMKLKMYCHRAADASIAGGIGGGIGAGFGAYCFEQYYRKICSDVDHQIGHAEEVGLRVGKAVSLPAGSLVGASVAKFLAGFQSVSMLGPMKFQVCALLSGAAVGFAVAVAVTGATTAIGLCVTQMTRETAKCMELAQEAKERREKLQQKLQDVTIMTTKLKAIAGKLVAVEQLVNDAQKALQQGLHSEEDVIKWIGVAQVAKLGLEQILKALDAVEKDVLDHFQELERTHARTVQNFFQALESQRRDTAETRSFCGSTWPLLIFPPLWFAVNDISEISYQIRSQSRWSQVQENIRSGIEQELGMLQLAIQGISCSEHRGKCQALIKEVEDLLDHGAEELEKLLSRPQTQTQVGCISQIWSFVGIMWPFPSEDSNTNFKDSWLVQNLIHAY